MNTKADRLTARQKRTAERLADPDFNGTISELCREMGIARSTFYRWMEQEKFARYLDEQIRRFTDGEYARAWKSLIQRVENGDLSAIKTYFDLRGKDASVPAGICFVDDVS